MDKLGASPIISHRVHVMLLIHQLLISSIVKPGMLKGHVELQYYFQSCFVRTGNLLARFSNARSSGVMCAGPDLASGHHH